MKPLRKSLLPLSLVACMTLLGTTACGSSGSSAAGADKMTIKTGSLTVGTNMPYAPMEYFGKDGKTPVGLDIDLMTEVAKRLNLTLDIQNTAWDGLIPAAKANRYDVVWASIGDFKDRQKQLDFVDYLSVRLAVVTKTADAAKFKDAMALCGKKVGGAKGSVAINIAQEFSDECKAASKPSVKITEFPDTPSGLIALRSGRSDAQILDGPNAVYEAQTAGGGTAYKVTMDAVGPVAIYGVGINKANPKLRDAVSEQLNAMIKDGKYKEILQKNGLGSYAIAKATVNAGGEKN